MTTIIHRTVEISKDRRLRLDLAFPEEVPTGRVEMTITVSPVKEDAFKDTPCEKLRTFAGAFAGSKAFERDGTTIQREMRDEWE